MEQNQTCLHAALFVCIGMGGDAARTYLRGNLQITASSMSNGLFVAPRANTRSCSLANHSNLSMSAFLQTMLENLRPIPLMEVMANMSSGSHRCWCSADLESPAGSTSPRRSASSSGSHRGRVHRRQGAGGGAPTLPQGPRHRVRAPAPDPWTSWTAPGLGL
jgi:hypothetical protein